MLKGFWLLFKNVVLYLATSNFHSRSIGEQSDLSEKEVDPRGQSGAF